MKFAHLSDCHIGGWREEEMKEVSIRSFERAMEISVEEEVEFVIISGDLFNTSLPSIDALKRTTTALKVVHDAKIAVYIIPGSHDFSPSRKTMLDVLENAGLCVNVFKQKDDCLLFTRHKTKEGKEVKLTGMVGLAGGLEKTKYHNLKNKEALAEESGLKIFLFHTLLTELKPNHKNWEQVPSEPLGLLPKNFAYYAGGHPHFVLQKSFPDHPLVTYPGPLSPNNFKEIEELGHGGFFIVEQVGERELLSKHVPVVIKETVNIQINAEGKTPQDVERDIVSAVEEKKISDKIVTIRVFGTLTQGKTSDVDFKKIKEVCKDAYVLLKNTTKLKTKEFAEVEVSADSIDEIELLVIREHVGKVNFQELGMGESEEQVITQLMFGLEKEKNEGERSNDFEKRVMDDSKKMLHLEKMFL